MTDHVARLYALAVAVLVFFVVWAAVAAKPWATSSRSATAGPDPQVQALIVKQQRVRAEALAVRRVLAARRQQGALPSSTPPPVPSVRVVTLPPLTITRTS